MTLAKALEELERSNPEVRAAAAKYDFVVWRLNRKAERRARDLDAIRAEAESILNQSARNDCPYIVQGPDGSTAYCSLGAQLTDEQARLIRLGEAVERLRREVENVNRKITLMDGVGATLDAIYAEAERNEQ